MDKGHDTQSGPEDEIEELGHSFNKYENNM